MQRMNWTAELYGTGNITVDTQHKELFSLINIVLDSFEKKEPSSTMQFHIDKLAGFAKKHFTCEEGIMERTKCSSCSENKKAHHMFLTEFTRLHEKLLQTGPTIIFQEDFYKFVCNWLRNHIMIVDTNLKESVQQ